MSRHFRIAKLTSKELAFNNSVYFNPLDMQEYGYKDNEFVLIDEVLVYQSRMDNSIAKGTVGTSNLIWKSLHLEANEAIGKTVTIEKWQTSKLNKNIAANTISFVVDTYSKINTEIKAEELEQYILQRLGNQIFCRDQRWIISWEHYGVKHWLNLKVAAIFALNEDDEEEDDDNNKEEKKTNEKLEKKKWKRQQATKIATLEANTTISIMAASNPFIKLIQPTGRSFAFGPDWDAERLGIGGLDTQFSTIFRRAFASRLYPPDIIQQLGVKHVKGMLLYGPPGTGKTLIARNIGAMLTENEPKVVNGPEILNKFVGQSEENIRALFAEAIKEQSEKGDKSSLHIIIFDEIDAICKQRGSNNAGGTGVHDTVVNQLLSMIDGVNSLNNVLVIGMTNRKDLLDDALLRSGRLEVHIEIGLPDEEGREQIFRIHTKALRENGKLDENISISELAKRTKNYTGAEIEAVVRSAVSFAMQQMIDVDNINSIDIKKLRNIKITQEFFNLALEEVKPELGKKNDEQMVFSFSRGIYHFNDKVSEIIHLGKNIISKMKRSNVMNRQALLFIGNNGCGKTALASFIAKQTNYPFIRIINSDNFVGLPDVSICNIIAKIFNDAYKSNHSVIILDDIERIIGYTVGPRFSNAIFQALVTCIRRPPIEQTRKIFIIGTCTANVCRSLEFDKMFDFVRNVPTVNNREEFEIVLKESKNDKYITDLKQVLNKFPEKKTNNIGIADLLTVLELSIDDNGSITPQSFENAWNSKFTSNMDLSNDLPNMDDF